jgi:DNA-binding NarL/FixJ family response regulator
VDELERGRDAHARSAWIEARDALARADEAAPLAAEDLELLATAEYMLGSEENWARVLERAHHRYTEAGEACRAARCAFWIGTNLAVRGQMGPATGWLGRAARLIEDQGDCAERGFLLVPVVFQHEAEGDLEGAAETAAAAAEIARRFGDRELFPLALHLQGDVLVRSGRVREGLAVLDEAMVAATGRDLNPMVTGIVYCGVILACESVFELRRAREWTAVLTRWCEGQPDLLAFTGTCRVHRADLLRLQGDWASALQEAERAGGRSIERANRAAAARASYLRGEVHRLRGEAAEAEEAYRDASRLGAEPQPGLTLLRLGQGNVEAATASIRRVLAETHEPLRRAALLPTLVEVMLASGDLEAAREACSELEQVSTAYDSELLRAQVSHARGAIELAAGDPAAALSTLRAAFTAWQELEAPYEAARARVLLAHACRALGDEDAFALDLDTARRAFEELGAAPDAAALASPGEERGDHGLSARELEVLRLVAVGKSNREIASELVISEHTVARHVQNIFRKLHVPSRTAAGAFAFEHGLL